MANTVYSASLVMTADVGQAKAQLKSLQQSLDDIIRHTHTTNNDLGLTKGINNAITQAGNLKIALDQAMNVNTGKLDLTKFASSLKATGTDIQQIANSLSSLGIKGQQAFTQLTSSILNAEVPLKRTNRLLNDFKQTFSNTIKWGISSAIFNKIIGGLESAYGYAQDLDKSLNNIRIVTGYGSNEMAKFAKQANEAAKALKTTTTSYTDASLIYYQQGLDSKAVKERTEATIKMANVTGESAKSVSDYMTAIWNNFDDGSKSLEYYADVMTALGAATASSTDEIAAGLEKFAAVSETVGLSYEYATAALATVTAETRQSADVVGNAFKTLFSRIQGLNLGETMDDGTDLNKYSQALAKVGVDIKDTNGQIKQMDVILDELGAKWGTLSNDTQMALAQAVAGVRQYNQLISLMNNWDTFKINLQVAEGAEGTLNEQQAIYAESWEAATEQVRTAFEHLWDAIIDEKALIGLTKGFAEVVDQIGNIVDAMGGMKGVLSAISFLITKSLVGSTQLFGQNIKQAVQEAENLRIKTMEAFKSMSQNNNATDIQKEVFREMYSYQEKILQKTKDLLAVNYQLTDEQKKQISFQNDRVQQLGNEVIENEQELQRQQTRNQNYISRQVSIQRAYGGDDEAATAAEAAIAQTSFNDLFSKFSQLGAIESQVDTLNAKLQTLGKDKSGLVEFQGALTNSIAFLKDCGINVDALEKEIENLGPDTPRTVLEDVLKKIIELMQKIAIEAGEAEAAVAGVYGDNVTRGLTERGYAEGRQKGIVHNSRQDFGVGMKEGEEALRRLKAEAPKVSQSFMAIGNAISSVTMLFSSFKGLVDTWNNEDMTFGEKLLSTFTTLGMMLPMLASSFSAFNIQQMSTVSNLIRTSPLLTKLGVSSVAAGTGLQTVGAGGVAAGAGLQATGAGATATAAGLWSIIWPIGLVIAGLGALIGIIYGISKAIDNSNYTTKEQIENATKSVEELKTALDNTKTSAEELKNTFDSYDSAVNAIKECTKGTQEYYEALNNANQAALELINNNPEIKYSTNNDGLIEINKKSQEEILKQSQQNVNKATFALQSGEQKLRDLELQKQYEDDIYFKETEAFTYGDTLVSRKDKERLLKESLETPENGSYGELLVKAMEEIDSDLWASEEDRQSYIEDANKATQAYIEAITPYTKEIEKNRQSDLNAATAQVINYLGEEAENYSQEERAVFGAFLENEKEQTIQDKEKFYRETLKERDGANKDEDIAQLEKDWEKYKEITGLTYDLVDTDAIRGSSENRKIAYYDEEAGEEKFVTAQTLAAVVGAAEAFENLGITIQETTALLQGFGKASNAMTTFIATGSFNKVKKEDKLYQFDKNEELSLDTVKNSIRGQFDILDQETKNTLMTLAGIDISAEDAWEQYLDSLSQAAIDDEEAIRDIWSNVYNTDGIVNSETFSGLSYDTQKALSEALNEAFKRGGKEAQETLNDTLSTILSNNEGLEEEIMSIFNSIDWDDIDAWEQFNQQVLAIGGNLNGISEEPFVSVMAAIANSLPIDEIDTLISKLKELYSELGKVKAGDIISDEDLQKYRENGVDIQGYETAEGFRVTEDPDLTQVDTQDYETQAGLYNYIANDEDTWVENMQNKYGGFVEQAAASNNKNANSILQALLHRYSGDQLTQLKEQLGIGGIEDITTLNIDDSVEALRKFDSIYDKGQEGKFESGYMDQMRLTSYDDLNDLSKDKAFDYSKEETQNALQDYAYKGGEEYADALKDYQEAMVGLEKDSPRAIELTQQFHERLKKIENNKAADNIVELQDGLKDLTGEDYEESIGKIQENLEKIFGREVSEEWIKNNQDVIKQLTTGTDEARQKAYNQIQEQITKENLIKIGFAVDLSDAEAKLNEAQSILDNADISEDMVINCVGQGDFTSLITQLQNANVEATDIAAVLAAIGATHLSPEGFQQMAEALKALQEALSNPTEGNVDAAIEAFNQSFEMAMSGENPDVTPDMRQAGGTGGGSGGGSGKSSAETARDKQMKAIDDEIARSEKAREGKSPDAQHDAIMREIELLEEQQKILEEQTDQWKELMKAKVEAFNDKYASMGFEIELTDDGMIANLSELYGRLAVELEEAEDGSQEERMLEKMMDDLDDAAQLQGQIDDNVASIADKEREQAEKTLEDITQRIDWRVKQIDYQIELLNYYQEKLLKQAHGNKQTIEAMLEGFKYQEQEMLALFEKGDTLRQGIAELNAAKAQYPDYAQMFDEQILEYQSDLIDVNMDILELRAEMEELVQNVLELALQEIDTQTQRIDKYVSMLDHFQNIIDLSGRTMLDQSLKVQIGTAKVETMVNKMGILKQQMEGLSAATKQAQDALAARRADNDESSVKFWENQVEMLKQELETATEEFLGSWEDVLEEAGNLFEMRVELAVQTMSDALSPFSSLELFQNNYNQDKTIRDQYLDDATRIYELNKLNRELNRAVTDENDLLAKSKLRDIQQQIYELQRSGVEMSQFDLEILQKKYDLQLAEIALMEAQNSKTSMRLIRDAAGNWTYAYDADEESIEDATQKYEDAIYELDQLAKEYIDDVSDQLIENQIEYKDALMDLDRNSADYQDQLLRLQEYYTNRQLYLLQELNKGVEESGIAFHDTLYGQMNDIYDYETAYDQFLTNSNTTVAELMTNYKDWQSVVEEAMNVAGTSWENFSGDMGTSLESMEDYIKALCDEISKLVDVLMSYVSTSISMVEEWQEKYSKMVDENLAKNEAVMNTDYINGGQWVSPSGIGPGGSSGGSSGGGSRSGGSFGGGTSTYPRSNNNNNSIKGNNDNSTGGINYYDNPYIQRSGDATSREYTQWSGELNHSLSAIEAAELYMLQKADDVTDDLDLLASAFSPQSGWCAKWVADIIEATEGDVKRGNAWDMLLANGGTPYDGTGPQNGSIVGYASNSGGYGHVMIYQDGYLYGTTGEDGQVGRISWEDYLAKGYESTRIAAPTNTEAGERAGSLARSVYVQTGGTPVSLPDDTCPKCGKRLSDCDCDQYDDNPYNDDPVKPSDNDDSVKPFDTDRTMAPNGTVIVRTEEGREYYKNGKLVLKDMMFDTGGYTGEWGPEGKLAWLHEKELVLNKKDTDNILDAVSIARSIDSLIYGLTSNTNWKLSNLIGQINPMFENTPIEQRVQINAEFPGVTDQYEIQEAFANLTNDASQYLNLNKY